MKDPQDEIREALEHPDFLERIDAIRGYDAAEKRLLDRLEAAEKDIALKERVIDSLGSTLNAVANERDALRAELADLRSSMTFRTSLIGRIEAERDALQAKVEAMERQEPVAWCATDETGTVIEALGMNQSRRFDTALYLAPGAQPAPSIPESVMEVIAGLVYEVERNICPHEETHRGGQWEICDMCGAKWADDRGGKPEFKWPAVVERARAMLAAAPEAKP